MEFVIYTLLLATCGASVALAAYSQHNGTERRFLPFFFGCCYGLMVWAFGLAVTAGARKQALAALGHRVAMLGWSVTACMALTFFLALTGMLPLLKKWWFCLLAYLPSFAVVLVYTVFPFFGIHGEKMLRTPWGWVCAGSPNDLWVWVYCLQALLLLAIGGGILLRWRRHNRNESVSKQVTLLWLSILVASLLGISTDILPLFIGVFFPQIAAVFILLPITTISYAMHRHRFMQPEDDDPQAAVLNRRTRTHVYTYLGMIALAFALLNLILYPWFGEKDLGAVAFSLFLFLIAACFTVSNLLKVDESFREFIVSLCLSFVLPVTALWSVYSGNRTAWAIVFVLIISALLFNRLIVLATFGVSALLTQLFIWAYQPDVTLEVGAFAYAIRLLFLAAASFLALYVHRVYVRRLKENANYTVKQELMSELSHSFISVGENNMEEKLDAALERCGTFIRCDRAYLILSPQNEKAIQYSREWLADGVPSGLSEFKASLKEMGPSVRRQMERGKVFILRDAALLPLTAGKLKRHLRAQHIRALMTIPLKSKGKIVGFLGFNAKIPFRMWNLDDYSFLEVSAGIFAEAVMKVEAERKVRFIAYHDRLTGLPNRLLFNDRLKQAISLSERTGKMLAIVFVDLDSFKAVNDTMGHEQGDQLLRQVADILTRCVRGYDTVCRFGGDEFLLLLNQLPGTPELLGILKKLSEILRKPILLKEQETFVTASIGVARFPQDGTDAETLIKNADTAMYHAKENGKNRYALCSQDMKDKVLEQMRLSNLLYRALEKGQLELFYQPQVDLKRKTITGCEALIRWRLPERGMVMPATFIPLAEETGLIQPIGLWALETACRQNKRWCGMGFPELRMAVNLSVHQLKNPSFSRKVGDILKKTGLPPENLELEITESVANGTSDGVLRVLNDLKALGVSISIDDFGTEYSSLSRLKMLPVDRIKIDMQFVQGIERNEKDQAISKVIINLAKNLNLKVIAEGVETFPQLDFLRQKMCDEVQGFYFYHPMPAAQAEKVLLKGMG